MLAADTHSTAQVSLGAMESPMLLAVPNVSEGRDEPAIAEIGRAFSAGGDQLGFVYGGAPGQAQVSSANPTSYDVVAHSTSGNNFTISRDNNGAVTRTCTAAGDAGCKQTGTW